MAHSQQFRIVKSGLQITSKEENRECLKNIIKVYNKAEGLLSILHAIKLYVVSKIILYHRLQEY